MNPSSLVKVEHISDEVSVAYVYLLAFAHAPWTYEHIPNCIVVETFASANSLKKSVSFSPLLLNGFKLYADPDYNRA